MLEIQAELKVETKNMNKESNKPDEDDEESEITEPRGNSNVLPKENQNAGKGN
jgi:hypothetical protein